MDDRQLGNFLARFGAAIGDALSPEPQAAVLQRAIEEQRYFMPGHYAANLLRVDVETDKMHNVESALVGIPLEDFRAYPASYLIDTLELSMKAILIAGTKMLALKDQPEVDRARLLSTHSLDWLRAEVERVLSAYGWSWDCGNKHLWIPRLQLMIQRDSAR